MEFDVLCARLRVPLGAVGVVTLAVGRFGLGPLVTWVGAGLLVFGLALYFRVGTVRREPVEVEVPVAGRWTAVNSPATRVPSHGLHAYGQTYAIDLVYDPQAATRPGFAWWSLARRPAEFPGFGQPVYAPAAGRVVRVHGSERDHWSRTSVLGLVWFLVESLREFFGPNKVLGNHVVIKLQDGTYALVAHLQRGSLTVVKGDLVDPGTQVGACGNSGNSTQPHVHLQLMDHRNVLLAAGLPVRFSWTDVDGRPQSGMPATGQFVSTTLTRSARFQRRRRAQPNRGRRTPRSASSSRSTSTWTAPRRAIQARAARARTGSTKVDIEMTITPVITAMRSVSGSDSNLSPPTWKSPNTMRKAASHAASVVTTRTFHVGRSTFSVTGQCSNLKRP